MKKLVLSGFLASEEIYINQLEALLLVRRAHTHTHYQGHDMADLPPFFSFLYVVLSVWDCAGQH